MKTAKKKKNEAYHSPLSTSINNLFCVGISRTCLKFLFAGMILFVIKIQSGCSQVNLGVCFFTPCDDEKGEPDSIAQWVRMAVCMSVNQTPV